MTQPRRPGPALTFFISMMVCAVVFIAFDSNTTACAQSDENANVDFAGLDIQATAGWDGFVDQASPIPLSFLMSNFSENPIEGHLILTDPMNDRTLDLGEVFLGPASVKRYSSIQAMPDWFQCTATFTDGETVFWKRELALTTGRDFSSDVIYLMFVDDGGRMLQLPVTEPVTDNSGRYVAPDGRGLPVQPVAVKSWQVPQHPGPMTVAQALVFSETAKPDMLNEVQWEAVARWVCLGGTVFLPETSAEILQQLKASAPLELRPSAHRDGLGMSRLGSGSIRTYAASLFDVNRPESLQQVALAASRLSRQTPVSMLHQIDQGWWESNNADKTRILVIVLFGGYTLLSGIGSLLLFRLNRRQISVYIGSIVAIACVTAIALAGLLKSSPGDLRMVTIACVTEGGLTETGRLDVQSAGGRNSKVAIQGRRPDLQLMDSSVSTIPFYYYGGYNTLQSGFPAFAWQGNLLPEEPNVYQIGVPITPWGTRRLYASVFQPDTPGLKLELRYQPPVASQFGTPQEFPLGGQLDGLSPSGHLQLVQPQGQFELYVENKLAVGLRDVSLILGWTGVRMLEDSGRGTFDPRTGMFRAQAKSEIGQLYSIESVASIGAIAPNDSVTHSVSGFVDADDSQFYRSWFPVNTAPGSTSVWITGSLNAPLALAVDQEKSDFEPIEGLHLYAQEIPFEQLPAEWLEVHERQIETMKQLAEQSKIAQ